MLNIFPTLLDFELLAPFIIRIVAGFIFINLGFLKYANERERWASLFKTFLKMGTPVVISIAFIEMLGGALLVLGLYTQLAALVLAILAFMNLYLELKDEALVKRTVVFHLMLFAMTISLLFSGAGFLAFDWPL